MATDLEKLVVQLSTDIRGYEREMQKASGVATKQARAIEKRFRAMQTNLDGIGKRAARSLVAPFAGVAAALGGRELIRMTSAWTDLNSRVQQAAGGIDQGAAVMSRLSEVARRTYSDLTNTAEGYLGFATTMRELGVSTQTQLDFVESLNNALVVSGAKGEVAERVMTALSKAMALGSLQGDNLNTVIASGGRVAQALAASMGVTTTQLRKLGQDGKIGRQEILGITREMGKLRKEAEAMPGTIQDGFTLLNNALLEYVGNADQATGVSAKIAEALTLLADNFDVVADTALKVASVLAAGLLGRSLAGMVSRLGSATTVLVKFGAALKAAATMGQISTALGGLGAAAGPLGAVFGAVLAGGLILYNSRAQEAAARTDAVRAELERVGLAAPKTRRAVDDAAESIDNMVGDRALANLAQLRAELDRVNGGSWADWFGFGSMDDSIVGLSTQIDGLTLRWEKLSDGEKAAIEKTRTAIREYQSGNITLADLVTTMMEVTAKTAGFDAEVVRLTDNLRDVAIYANGIELRAIAEEAPETLARVNGEIAQVVTNLRDWTGQTTILADEISRLHPELNADEVAEQVDTIIRTIEGLTAKVESSEASAEDANRALAQIGSDYSSINAFIGALQPLLVTLAQVQAAARAAAAALPGASGSGAIEEDYTGPRHQQAAQLAANREWLAEQARLNAMSREGLALEREVASVREQSLAAGVRLTEAQIEAQARANIAAEEARRNSGGGKGGGGRGGGAREGLFGNAEREIADLQREIELIGKSTAEVAKARAEQELLNAAKSKGIPITDALLQKIGQHASEVGRLTEELARGRATQEKFESGIEDISRAFADAIVAGEDLRASLSRILRQMASDILSSGINRLLGSLFDGLFSTGRGSAGGVAAQVGHSGGTAGSLSGRRTVSPLVFAGARRMHSGGMVGLRPDEVPAILQRGERVLSRQQVAAGGGGSGAVEIVLHAPEGFTAEQMSTIEGVSVRVVSAGFDRYDRALPGRVQNINANPRRR